MSRDERHARAFRHPAVVCHSWPDDTYTLTDGRVVDGLEWRAQVGEGGGMNEAKPTGAMNESMPWHETAAAQRQAEADPMLPSRLRRAVLRDEFAKAALAALGPLLLEHAGPDRDPDVADSTLWRMTARTAYRIADAMLEEREGTGR